jgi:hypothetical protein
MYFYPAFDILQNKDPDIIDEIADNIEQFLQSPNQFLQSTYQFLQSPNQFPHSPNQYHEKDSWTSDPEIEWIEEGWTSKLASCFRLHLFS